MTKQQYYEILDSLPDLLNLVEAEGKHNLNDDSAHFWVPVTTKNGEEFQLNIWANSTFSCARCDSPYTYDGRRCGLCGCTLATRRARLRFDLYGYDKEDGTPNYDDFVTLKLDTAPDAYDLDKVTGYADRVIGDVPWEWVEECLLDLDTDIGYAINEITVSNLRSALLKKFRERSMNDEATA